jgi:subtilase family serine protease
MRRNVVRTILFSATTLILLGASFLTFRIFSARADGSQPVVLAGQITPLVQQAQVIQAADTSQQLNLSIGLQWQNQDQLDAMLSAMYDPQSPSYHQFLTPDQFDQLFAPSSDQVQQVVAYLQSQGMTVTNVAPNNLLIDASGTVAQAEQAFHTQINTYQLGAQTFYANAAAPAVPASISPLIASISGLDNSVQYQPLYQLQASHLHHAASGPTSGYAPKDLEGAYDIAPLQNANILGDNQTIALFELDGYQQSDVNQYFQYYNLGTPNINNVLVDGASGAAGQGAIEVELDIEIAAAMAPHANLLVYEAPNTTQGMNDLYNRIVSDNKAQIVSVSWGLCERSSGPAELQTLDNILKQGAAQGMSFFAAAGDSGAYDCQDTSLAVDSPASDPYVTGVGGTTLQLNNGAYGSETVWSNPNATNRGPKGAGGGGGLSNTFKEPSWQSGPGVQNQYSNGYREVPDVSANADPNTGYAMYCTVTNAGCPSTGWIDVGGTSAGAPLWAGSTALINQYLQSQGKSRVGYANPTLYTLYNAQQQYPAFHDITSGNNLYYPATSNYDLASGMGSPDIYNIARDLTGGSPPPTPSPSPSPTTTPSPTPSPSPTPPAPTSLIQNGDFENGQAPWQESSAQGYQLLDTINSYSGIYSAYLCGYEGCDDRIWQTFTVPNSYTTITVTYWWYSDTNKTTRACQDTFVSQLQTTSGALIHGLQYNCNTSVTNNWVQENFDVSAILAPYKGKQVTIFFRGITAKNQPQTSDFFVDLVAVNAS